MYDHEKIEKKWQKKWLEEKVYEPDLDDALRQAQGKRKPFYNLMMFPYPSAEGLHVGNVYAFTGADIYGRMKRMQGHDVFEPIGLDGFGIHSENYALKIGTHPADQAKVSEKRFYEQLKSIGNGFAWNEHLETYNPEYYRWTQWIFLQMWKNGLAYRKKQSVNWCPKDLTVLSDEQVIAGKCERCNAEVQKKELEQWFFKITNYAERLLKNLDALDWSEKVKIAQKNWIGKSEGATIRFPIVSRTSTDGTRTHTDRSHTSQYQSVFSQHASVSVEVFTTRPDTLFGATFMVVSPELAKKWTSVGPAGDGASWQAPKDVVKYVEKSLKTRELDRIDETREKTGVATGIMAINPANKEEIPVWVADYVLGSYGTGAIMAVPAHDERDFEFAKKFGLPVREVVRSVADRECLILHGITGHSRENWFPWLKEQLEAEKWKVFVPDLPNTDHPTAEEWRSFLLKNYGNKLTENSIVVGHSLGAKAAIDFIQASNKKIGKLILVAPTSNAQNWPALKKEVPEVDWVAVENFNKVFEADWRKLSDLAKEVVVYYSDNDPYINDKTIRYYQKNLPNASYRLIRGRFHFSEYSGIKEFSEILLDFIPLNTDKGILVNSGKFDGMDSEKAKWEITKAVSGERKVQFRLRDWLISRQRYWGPPIPMVHCEACAAKGVGERKDMAGWYAVPEVELPMELPYVKNFRPTGSGTSPLAAEKSFHETKCPSCGGAARRETDVSDTFLDSAWYYLRYLDTANEKSAINAKRAERWLPVDMYTGGAEHAVLHLLYVRFVAMALHDWGFVKFEEPFKKFRAHGLLIKDGAKMSKSKGNVINPDEYIKNFGADVLRMYLMFLAPFEEGGDFRDAGILGVERFLKRFWNFFEEGSRVRGQGSSHDDPRQSASSSEDIRVNPLLQLLHKTIKKVTEDIEHLHYNTAVSALMILLNEMEQQGQWSMVNGQLFIKLLAPFAPHMTEEIWQEVLGHKTSIHREPWPEYDVTLIKEEKFTLVLQVNGKVRDTVEVESDITEARAKELALQSEKVKAFLVGKEPKKLIYVPKKLVNIVVY